MCQLHDNYIKTCGFGKYGQLDEEEVRRRILAWGARGIEFQHAGEHDAFGGRLLADVVEEAVGFA